MPEYSKWILVVKENNKTLFAAEKIQIKPSSLDSLLEKAFWAGFKYNEELQKLKGNSGADKDLGDFFGNLFKNK